MTRPRLKTVVVYLTHAEYAVLEKAGHADDRDPFQQARYLLVGLLRRQVDVACGLPRTSDDEAGELAELAPSTAAD